MTVGGSKGSLCGNYAMEHADLLVAVGTRCVCQSDCSRTGYPKVRQVININADVDAAMHYNGRPPLVGRCRAHAGRLNEALRRAAGEGRPAALRVAGRVLPRSGRRGRRSRPSATPARVLHDEVWGGEVLTQPAAIKAATDWARANDVVSFFDAGDVQANGFQIVEDDRPGRTFTETGASYMGFAVSALLATGLAQQPFYGLAFTGDGSFTMNPQILIDGVEHGARGCILLLDNRRMGAISGLADGPVRRGVCHRATPSTVDYVAWARAVAGVAALDGGRTPEALLAALEQARAHDGLTLVHVPVYCGPDPLGGMGVFGRWNVGNWCADTQALRHPIGL